MWVSFSDSSITCGIPIEKTRFVGGCSWSCRRKTDRGIVKLNCISRPSICVAQWLLIPVVSLAPSFALCLPERKDCALVCIK